jgi:pimeloyl-ACP methyl ester carboxylesterase
VNDAVVTLGDGRTLAYVDFGEPAWPCLFFFHGAPVSRLHLAYLEERFRAARVRVVAPDRPAYGRSSPQPGRTMAEWPADVAALADVLGIARFLVAGHSSGGPYAVACAALLPERVVAGVVLGGVTDMGWPGAWDGYNEMEARLMRIGDEAATVAACVAQFGADGSRFGEGADFEFSPPDAALFADPHAGPLITAAMAEAFRQGVVGYAQDVAVQARPWPFRPDDVRAPVTVVHGTEDRVVPIAHGRHTAEVVPGATLRVLAGHGHMTPVSELPALVAALA